MTDFIENALRERRSMGMALADLLKEYQRSPSTSLARTIEMIRTEIDIKAAHLKSGAVRFDPTNFTEF